MFQDTQEFIGISKKNLINYIERVNAYKEFVKDTEDKNFNDPKITSGIEDKEYESFLKLSESIIN